MITASVTKELNEIIADWNFITQTKEWFYIWKAQNSFGRPKVVED